MSEVEYKPGDYIRIKTSRGKYSEVAAKVVSDDGSSRLSVRTWSTRNLTYSEAVLAEREKILGRLSDDSARFWQMCEADNPQSQEVNDSYTSVEAMLFEWFRTQDIPVGRGQVLDLAVKASNMIRPFRDYYRACAGHCGYDIRTCTARAEKAEKEL
jgi:hypothetical protein